MDPLFETTIQNLVENTKKRIAEIEVSRDEKRMRTFKKAQCCDSFEKLFMVMMAHRENDLENKIKIYNENLEYLLECDQKRKVLLNQTEWRHYFHGTQRPEWC